MSATVPATSPRHHFDLQATSGQARVGLLSTPHGDVPTPAFMPVATQGAVKALTPQETRELGASILLANTYHLSLRPGIETIARLGGLHAFMRWDGPILTDSGGFQAYSLGMLRRVTDDGLVFTSHIDGSQHRLSPELVVRYQEALGVDIAMVLDQCIGYGADVGAMREAMERTHRWARRCYEARTSNGAADTPPPLLFGIVQGGTDLALRDESVAAITGIDFDGYAVGGLSVGEPRALTYQVAAHTAPLLPPDRPRYMMGTGAPNDLVEAVAAGFDLFDCALPTRVARNGAVFTSTGRHDITKTRFKEERGPLEPGCDCSTCDTFDAAYIHHLFRAHELLAYRLATIHNLRFYQRLMERMRQAIRDATFEGFRRDFHAAYTPTNEEVRRKQRGRWRRGKGHTPSPVDGRGLG
jgi:queuine tRNA-ribosyltransferase